MGQDDVRPVPTYQAERDGGEETIRADLDRLVADLDESGDLDCLKCGLSRFNVFEVLGAVESEASHSNFLAWLLSPSASHGLGDLFTKRFLRRVFHYHPSGPSPAELEAMQLSDMEVRREWANIDLCLISEANLFVVVIENKVGAQESDGQLYSYRNRVEREFPTAEQKAWKRFYFFLTVEGDAPTMEDYVAISHRETVNVIESITAAPGSTVAPPVKTFLEHYTLMMRSHHMVESELSELARKIYNRHRNAFDYIFEQRPNPWQAVKAKIMDRISALTAYKVDPSTDRSVDVRLQPKSWYDTQKCLNIGTGWKSAKSDAFILCKLSPDKTRRKARLQLILGPGPADVREKILKALRLANVLQGTPAPKWTAVMTSKWRHITEEDDTIGGVEKWSQDLIKDLDDFATDQVPRIEDALRQVFGEPTSHIVAASDD